MNLASYCSWELTKTACAAICRLRRVAAGLLHRLALPDPSIDRRSCMQLDVRKALFLTLNKALEQDMIEDDKDFFKEGLREVEGH